jgi:hypothetical protein
VYVHEHHEFAFYMVSGDEIELWTGDQLEHRETARWRLPVRAAGCAACGGQPEPEAGRIRWSADRPERAGERGEETRS